MKKIKQSIFVFILLLPILSFGQITFTKIPINKQLVARDLVTNTGNVLIEGQVDQTSSTYQSIQVSVFRNGISYGTPFTQTLNYSANIAQFKFDIKIKAELANYAFEIYGINGTNSTLINSVGEIVAGDVYVIQGQSNAVAKIREGSANENQNNFIRTFGSAIQSASGVLSQSAWYVAHGDENYWERGFVGQWGLKLAKLILDNHSIPVAIFNGAEGARSISHFLQPIDYKTSLESNYGKLYYRLNETGLKNQVKAIFWSQGESDFNTSTIDYYNQFITLKTSWQTDYPNTKQVVIFQTKSSCGSSNLMAVKEAQRLLAMNNNDIDIIQTSSLNYATGESCHFSFNGGYEEFAKRLYNLMDRDIYGNSTYNYDIETPMIIDAYLTNEKTLVVETDASTLNNNAVPADNFELENSENSSINNIEVSDNKIIFYLSQNPGSNATISYLGLDSGENSVNFITNSGGIELICFNKYPIKTSQVTIWNGTSWSNGIPNATKNAVIDGDFSDTSSNLIVKDLIINTGFTLNFSGGTTNSIIVNGDLANTGSLYIGDKESLVMYNDLAKINGILTKNEKSFYRNNKHDLTYWSSPIKNGLISDIFKDVDPNRIFYYDQSKSSASDPNNDPEGNYWDIWSIATGKMLPGVGYAAEGPIGQTGIHEIPFTGTPNNGEITVTMRGHFDDNDPLNDFNLIGNPYPSAIDIDKFLAKNSTTIDPTIYLWAHNTSQSGEDYTSSNYLAYNKMGGTSTSSDGLELPYKTIESGDGFFVRALNTQAVYFNNSMRTSNSISNSNVIDADNDGYPFNEDCNDSNPLVNPGITEILYNGIDDDCDPTTLDTIDIDQDGFNSDVDCDDNNAKIYPGAYDIPNNNIDEDCNGKDKIDKDENCKDRISGNFNIDPSNSLNNFILTTSEGEIDLNTLSKKGAKFSYSGAAKSLKIKVKGKGNKIKVNGSKVSLYEHFIYEFTGNFSVSLKNKKKKGNWKKTKDHWWITINGTDVCFDEGISCSNEISGSLNLNPAKSDKNTFLLKTPKGDIDINTLSKKGAKFSYSGKATLLKIKVKGKGNKVEINGSKVSLDKSTVYEFTGNFSVALKNKKNKGDWKKSKGHWWISINGEEICIAQSKKKDGHHDDDKDDDKNDDDDDHADDNEDNKANKAKVSEVQEEVDRIWLDLKTDKGGFDQVLIGFTNQATDKIDNGYDALKMMMNNNSINFYSVIENKKYVIQGLSTFSEDKIITLGFNTKVKPRKYSISIARTEGKLNNVEVFLNDHLLNITHNLRSSNYEFEQNTIGESLNRFSLQFVNSSKTLGTDNIDEKNRLIVSNKSGNIKISAKQNVISIKAYNIIGKILINEHPNEKTFLLQTQDLKTGTILFLKVVLENGSVIHKKIIKL